MAGSPPLFGAVLPRHWSKRVRSAVLHTISLAQVVLANARGWASGSWDGRVRLEAKVERLEQEVALLQEEIRIKDARMLKLDAQRRPHYPPVERLSILQLRTIRGWSLTQTAKRLLVTTATVAAWMHRVDDEGPDAIVRAQQPVNRFPDFVRYMVRCFKTLCPTLGTNRMAQMLCRAGLHLSATSIRRMVQEQSIPDGPCEKTVAANANRKIKSKYPSHIWLTDLTTVPTSLGFWTSLLPFALPQRWPFCWWVAVVIDHYSRRVMGTAVFRQEPTSLYVRTFLRRVIRKAGANPRHLITDHGVQFTDGRFRTLCRRRGIRQRFGAVGKYGSIALIERFMRTLKQECTRRLLVPFSSRSLHAELVLFTGWYNGKRPHTSLLVATPNEIYYETTPACQQPRFEPRPRWPRMAPCARPAATVQGELGARLELHVSYLAGRKHLPIVELKPAA